MWTLDDIAKGVKGAVYRAEKDTFTSISTDSRSIGPGDFFVPLKGANFDGHSFIDAAYERSGGGALCDTGRREVYQKARGTIVLVADTNQALLELARFRRKRTQGAFVAITGSNGKTTTKELLVHVVGDRLPLVFNEKNYNNQIGVAKTLLAIESSPDLAILELGTNHPGEIEVLSRIVEPHLSLITNVNPSHLEGFVDLDGVRREKLSLFEGTMPGGTVFVNLDDPSLASYAPKSGLKAVGFAIRERADFALRVVADRGLEGFDITLRFPGGEIGTTTPLLGHHNLYNVLAASVLARAVGIPDDVIAEGARTFGAYNGRFRPVRSRKGYIVVDDTYNANPASMEWAISTLLSLPCRGRRIAALGAMKELGEKTERYHRDLGRTLRESSLSLILLLGDETRPAADVIGNGRAKHFTDKEALIDFLSTQLDRDDIVLIKGSRALGMDEIVEALT